MTKPEFLKAIRDMYRVANLSDSDHPGRQSWTKPEMAGTACCRHLNKMIREMWECGAFTKEDVDWIHDTL